MLEFALVIGLFARAWEVEETVLFRPLRHRSMEVLAFSGWLVTFSLLVPLTLLHLGVINIVEFIIILITLSQLIIVILLPILAVISILLRVEVIIFLFLVHLWLFKYFFHLCWLLNIFLISYEPCQTYWLISIILFLLLHCLDVDPFGFILFCLR